MFALFSRKNKKPSCSGRYQANKKGLDEQNVSSFTKDRCTVSTVSFHTEGQHLSQTVWCRRLCFPLQWLALKESWWLTALLVSPKAILTPQWYKYNGLKYKCLFESFTKCSGLDSKLKRQHCAFTQHTVAVVLLPYYVLRAGFYRCQIIRKTPV